jgi:putative sterol carrier protein
LPGKSSRAIALLVDYMNKTKEVKEFVSGWESRIEFCLTGESPFGVLFSTDGAIKFHEGKLENPDVIFYASSDLFYGMLAGKIDQDEAFSNGQVDVKGSIFDSVRFRHAAETTQEKHSALFTVLRAVSRFT